MEKDTRELPEDRSLSTVRSLPVVGGASRGPKRGEIGVVDERETEFLEDAIDGCDPRQSRVGKGEAGVGAGMVGSLPLCALNGCVACACLFPNRPGWPGFP